MRIASFNVENLFSRVRALNLGDWDDGKVILAEYAKVNARLQKPVYNAADRQAIIASLTKLGLANSDESKWAILRQNRGKLVKRPQGGGMVITATGRGDWIGWVELNRQAVNETATRMTARVIRDIGADVLAVVEAEDRIALNFFNNQMLRPAGADYGQIMLIDGNDERGIDVGMMTRPGHEIESIVSHVDDVVAGNRVFSRDCPEYRIRVGGSKTLLVLVNHLKSKGFGNAADSDAKRRAQATRVREIYQQRRAEGADFIAVVGDLNDTPGSNPLSPLLTTDLRDISTHPNFVSDGRPGTWQNGTANNKLDYVLLSPALFDRVTSGGVERKGVWGGKNGTLFPHYPEMTAEFHAASDHAAIFADIDL